jgi:maltose-binding protein MalE
MKKSMFALLAILVVMSLFIAACGATPTPVAQPTAVPTTAPVAELAGKITLWHGWTEAEIPGLNAVIQAFQAKNPNVQFDVLYVPFADLRGKFETAAATGGGPTVLIGAADWGPAEYDAQLVASVSTMATPDFVNTLNPAALGPVQYKGALIGLPETIKGVIMYRNTSIIANAPTTWDDLVTAAKSATQGDVVGADLERGTFFAEAHLYGIGGKLMDNVGNPAFNDAKGIAWLNLTNSFKDAGPTEFNTDNDVNLFKAGKAGIIFDGTWNMSALADAVGKDKISIDPWPTVSDGSLNGYVQTENIYLAANATGDDQKASWAFMQYFLSTDAQAELAKVGHIPATLGVTVSDPLMAQAANVLKTGVAFPVIPEMGAYWGPMETAQKAVYDQGADPAAVLKTAYDTITAAIAQLHAPAGATPTP